MTLFFQDFVDRVVFSLQHSDAMAAPELQMMCGKELQAIQDFYTPKSYWILDVYFMFCPMILASPWYCDKNTGAHFPTNCAIRSWKMPWRQSCCLATRCWCVCKRRSDPKQICYSKMLIFRMLSKRHLRRLPREMVEGLKHVETTMVWVQW